MQFAQFVFESVLFDLGIGQYRSDAVFGNLQWLDSQLLQDSDHGGGRETVSLELDDGDGGQLARLMGLDIRPLEIHVDGEPFGLGLINQRDAAEDGTHLGQ